MQSVQSVRRSSTIHPRAKPSYRDLILGPVAKSLLLTMVFGLVVVEATRTRKDTEALRGAYATKFQLLREATEKIRARQPVDLALELKIANAITRNKYNSVTDVELDEQLEEFLKMAEDETEVEPVVESRAQVALAAEKASARFL